MQTEPIPTTQPTMVPVDEDSRELMYQLRHIPASTVRPARHHRSGEANREGQRDADGKGEGECAVDTPGDQPVAPVSSGQSA
jgi:hypothetical protein